MCLKSVVIVNYFKILYLFIHLLITWIFLILLKNKKKNTESIKKKINIICSIRIE